MEELKVKKVVICGSMSFLDRMKNVQKWLKEKGYEVIIPEVLPEEIESGNLKPWQQNGVLVGLNHTAWKSKSAAMRSYMDKVIRADAIVVFNIMKNDVEGYIGANAFAEMAIAFYHGTPIYIWRTPDYQNLWCGEEVLGMQPINLNGSVDNFNL